MKNNEVILTSKEKKIVNIIVTPISWILFALLIVIRFTASLVYKFKRPLYKLSVAFFILYNAYTALHVVAYAPRPAYALNGYAPVNNPKTEHQQIINYIHEVFGQDSDKAFKLLSCENHALNPNAINDNRTWGGVGEDVGVMQINTVYQGVSVRYLENWKVNVLIGYQIYKASGNHFTLWTCGKELGI